eukprot:3932182-Rhodomonas_salina.1
MCIRDSPPLCLPTYRAWPGASSPSCEQPRRGCAQPTCTPTTVTVHTPESQCTSTTDAGTSVHSTDAGTYASKIATH